MLPTIGLLMGLLLQSQTVPPVTAGDGRVVVTIVIEGLRIPSVKVDLRDVAANIVIAQTISDEAGQVEFPAVPASRYVVLAVREGFSDTESSPFNVQAGVTEQVLVEMKLTFVRGERLRRGARQLTDGKPAAGRGERCAEWRKNGCPAAGRR